MPNPRDVLLQPTYIEIGGNQSFFDTRAFDSAIRAHGVRFVHYRGQKCTVGVVDQYDQRQVHPDHEGRSNGFIYTRAGVVMALFTGNNKDRKQSEMGIMDAGYAQLTLARNYEDAEGQVMLMPRDRLYLDDEDIIVPDWETVTKQISGKDRLRHPVVAVVDLIDNRGVRYKQGVHFGIQGGQIIWTTGGPLHDPLTGAAALYTVRYTYRPYFYVDRMIKELRVAQERGADGVVKAVRMPQAVMVQREYIFEASQPNDPQALGGDPARQAKGPEEGSGGF